MIYIPLLQLDLMANNDRIAGSSFTSLLESEEAYNNNVALTDFCQSKNSWTLSCEFAVTPV